jgi:putative transposase
MPDAPHHVTQRGIRRLEVFHDHSDRQEYLDPSRKIPDAFLCGAGLLFNDESHVHFVVVPEKQDSIWKTFHRSHSIYAMKFNAKYQLCGHLWQGRAYSCVLDEAHLWAAVRYVELNPVRAGMVRFAEDYPWSSASAHCRIDDNPLIDRNWPATGLINNWSEWLRNENSPETDCLIRKATFKDTALR